MFWEIRAANLKHFIAANVGIGITSNTNRALLDPHNNPSYFMNIYLQCKSRECHASSCNGDIVYRGLALWCNVVTVNFCRMAAACVDYLHSSQLLSVILHNTQDLLLFFEGFLEIMAEESLFRGWLGLNNYNNRHQERESLVFSLGKE